MFFVLSKILYYFFMPVVLILFILLASLLVKKQTLKVFLKRVCLFSILFFSNPLLIHFLLGLWENPATPYRDIKQRYEAGILLTGITIERQPNDRVYFDRGADRLLHTLQLYRLGIIKKILISGGTIDVFGKETLSEAAQLKEVLRLAQVPEEDIILEEKSRNTRENALFSGDIIKKKFAPNTKFLLITSAFHIPRAKSCFKKVGVQTDTFSTDFLSGSNSDLSFLVGAIIPSEKALYRWHILIHEVIGYMAYAVVGYI